MPPHGKASHFQSQRRRDNKSDKSQKKLHAASRKAVPQAANEAVAASSRNSTCQLELQQRLLDVFRCALAPCLPSDLSALIQEVKGYLYERDFGKAFGTERNLEAYAIRWSAGRALGYLTILDGMQEHLIHKVTVPEEKKPDHAANETLELLIDSSKVHTDEDARHRTCQLKITCLGGGGGAEVAAVAAFARQLNTACVDAAVSLTVVDAADWSGVLQKLEDSIVNPLPQPKYAAASGLGNKAALLCQDRYNVAFHKCDLFDLTPTSLRLLAEESALVTIMFTLNELYATSMAKTTKLLLMLGSNLKGGTLLLVVDSPGSYSTIGLGNDETAAGKKYPMHWLLDHTLLSLAENDDDAREWRWEKLVEDDSRWFRLPEGLRYPVDLENMRYQIHLYRLDHPDIQS